MNLNNMKPFITVTVAVISFVFVSLSREAKSAISVGNFSLTETTVSFDISGVFPEDQPSANYNEIYFANTDLTANPGFVLGGAFGSSPPSAINFTGAQSLSSSFPFLFGFSDDSFYISFEDPFSELETISGTLTASWASTVFDPDEASMINVYWGYDYGSGGSSASGTYLTFIGAVPEPFVTAWVVVGGIAALALLRKRKGMVNLGLRGGKLKPMGNG